MTKDKNLVKCLRLFSSRRQPPLLVGHGATGTSRQPKQLFHYVHPSEQKAITLGSKTLLKQNPSVFAFLHCYEWIIGPSFGYEDKEISYAENDPIPVSRSLTGNGVAAIAVRKKVVIIGHFSVAMWKRPILLPLPSLPLPLPLPFCSLNTSSYPILQNGSGQSLPHP